MAKKMFYLIAAVVILFVYVGVRMTSRSGYESAEYTVLRADGSFEVREYPDLMLVATPTKFQSQGQDGSFGRLFGYISGGNDSDRKVAMTTPVFMEPEQNEANGQMSFVLPKKVAAETIPNPSDQNVRIQQRERGEFAVLRFTGRMNDEVRSATEAKLRQWIETQDLTGSETVEFAGYDPPWTPGLLRRNEILIRLQ